MTNSFGADTSLPQRFTGYFVPQNTTQQISIVAQPTTTTVSQAIKDVRVSDAATAQNPSSAPSAEETNTGESRAMLVDTLQQVEAALQHIPESAGLDEVRNPLLLQRIS